METVYLAGALATGIVLVTMPKFNRGALGKAVPEMHQWTDRYAFGVVSSALLAAALLWPLFWVVKLGMIAFRRGGND